MTAPFEKFENMFIKLFHSNSADLDFGIYRVMKYKRHAIENFIVNDLQEVIRRELQRITQAEQEKTQQALDIVRQTILETLGENALDSAGNLSEKYRGTMLGKTYIEAQAKAESHCFDEDLEASIYNHLYSFFEHYSKKKSYTVPYNGEDVYFYWADHDKYYVKTGEYFVDYVYKDNLGTTVCFRLIKADVEQNNIKGKSRFFLPILDGIAWNKTTNTITIPFEFRLLTEQESLVYGQKKQQKAINTKTIEKICEQIQEMQKLEEGKWDNFSQFPALDLSLLKSHLQKYTRHRTIDFFIHKDLKAFLTRELDLYIKHKVLDLEKIEFGKAWQAEKVFELARIIKKIGNYIIDFLAGIENLQKDLWEKKKFVTETFYVVTVGNIPEDFYPEIAACEAQWEEWKVLLQIDEEQSNLFTTGKGKKDKRLTFLKAHPTLPLDTRHFSQDFTDRLLAFFDNLDEATDGLLVHSENWQALNLLQEKYRERVKCVYIDPPFNTGKDGFPYKDGYQHSSWLSMIADRVGTSRISLLPTSGVLFCSISDHELARMRIVLDSIFGEQNFIANIEWNATKSVTNTALISVSHIHNLVYARHIEYYVQHRQHFRLPAPLEGFENPDNDPRGPWKADPFQVGGVRPNQQYEIRNPYTGRVYRPNQGCSWKNDYETFNRLLADGRIVFGRTGEGGPQRKRYLFEAEERGLVSKTWWDDLETTADGTRLLQDLFGTSIFPNPKPTSLIARIVQLGTHDVGQTVLDYYAGSGTTAHAVINLNREDGGRRKFILVEMAHYFDTVLLPRIKKVTFTPEWKDGKPKRMATAEEAKRSPRIIKVIRLESYEDALNNTIFDYKSDQQTSSLSEDDSLFGYILCQDKIYNTAVLDIERLQAPFSYQLILYRDGKSYKHLIDMPETFNYLLGIDIKTRKIYSNEGRRYLVYGGTLKGGNSAIIIWRKTQNWTQADYERDRDFVSKNKLTEGADQIFTNDYSLIPNAQSLDPIFKERLFANIKD